VAVRAPVATATRDLDFLRRRALNLEQLKQRMACPILIDLRNIYSDDDIDRHGFYYVGLGRQIVRKTLDSYAAQKYLAGAKNAYVSFDSLIRPPISCNGAPQLSDSCIPPECNLS
jgi:hypothetical protein